MVKAAQKKVISIIVTGMLVMLDVLKGFSKTLAQTILKISSSLVPIIKKSVGWLFRKYASKLTAQSLSGTLVGGITSIKSNSFLNALAPSFTVFLSVGGLVGGMWDLLIDGKLDGAIKLW